MLLAQLTDLHVKPRGRLAYRHVDTAACLQAAVAHLQRQPVAPDAVLVTGDLVDAGLPEEYALLRELLGPLATPVFLMPGNHDARAPLRAAFADHGYLGMDGPIRYAVEDFPVRILALDSLVEGETGGALGADQLDWLDRRLAEQPARPTAVAVHHPPFATGIGHMDAIGLRDSAGLAAVLARHPQVERVLSGHVHRAVMARFAGTVASIAPSVAHQVALDLRPDAPPALCLEPPGYQLHFYTAEAGLITHTAQVANAPGPFPFFEDGVLIA